MAQNDIIVPREGAGNVLTEIVLPDATTQARGLLSSTDKTKLDGIAAGAEVNVNADWNAASGDAQILNKPSTFAPSAHAADHAAGGSDPLAPSDIGAQSIFTAASAGAPTGAPLELTAQRARIWTVINTAVTGDADIQLPLTGIQVGDVAVIRGNSSSTANLTVKSPAQSGGTVLFYTNPQNTPSGNPVVISNDSHQYRFIVNDPTSFVPWSFVAVDTHTHAATDITSGTLDIARIPTGTSSSTVAIGNDARLSDARTPTSHAITTHTAGNHKVFYSDGSGNVQELALGATGTVLTSGGTATAPSFAAASGGDTVSIEASASDILSVASGAISADDAGADRIVFWDDSASKLAYLEAGSGLTISGTTISVAGGGATNLWIPASAWIPRTTGGCGVDSREIGATNRANVDELLFDTGTEEFAQALVVMPSNYDNSTLTARFYWTAASGSGGVAWGLSGRAYGDDDALDQATGTRQVVTDTLLAANDVHVTSATSAVTIAGTPAANKAINFEISREVGNGADDLAVDARLLGVEIIFN